MREELLSRLQLLLTQRRQTFTGIANSSGVGKLISVSLDDGRTIQAKSLNVEQTGSAIAVVFDDKKNEYLAFSTTTKEILTSRQYVYRKSRYIPNKDLQVAVSVLYSVTEEKETATDCTCPSWTFDGCYCRQVCDGSGTYSTLQSCKDANPLKATLHDTGYTLIIKNCREARESTQDWYFCDEEVPEPAVVNLKDLPVYDSFSDLGEYAAYMVGDVEFQGEVIFFDGDSYSAGKRDFSEDGWQRYFPGNVYSKSEDGTTQWISLQSDSVSGCGSPAPTPSLPSTRTFYTNPDDGIPNNITLVKNLGGANTYISHYNSPDYTIYPVNTPPEPPPKLPSEKKPSKVTNSFYLNKTHLFDATGEEHYSGYVTQYKGNWEAVFKLGKKLSPAIPLTDREWCKIRKFTKKVNTVSSNPDLPEDTLSNWQREWVYNYASLDPESANACLKDSKSSSSNFYKNTAYYVDPSQLFDGMQLFDAIKNRPVKAELRYASTSIVEGVCIYEPYKTIKFRIPKLPPTPGTYQVIALSALVL